MKKILGIVAGIVGIISVIVGVALKMNNNAIAIIGGADGPTSVFVAGKLNSVLVSIEYYGTAEPPVRCGESHLSGLTEPLHFVY